ncbi:MAG: transcription elongation factor GreB [Gammaproteobacteria bacterium]
MPKPPVPPSRRSPHITAAGFRRLQAELGTTWVTRREVVAALAAAAAEGDRSENAEYVYRKKQLRELDRRIRYLQKRLPELQVVDSVPDDAARVFFGAWATLEDTQGSIATYRIVGADEFDPKRRWISVDSPMARALLQRVVDEEVRVRAPEGVRRYRLVSVSYDDPG